MLSSAGRCVFKCLKPADSRVSDMVCVQRVLLTTQSTCAELSSPFHHVVTPLQNKRHVCKDRKKPKGEDPSLAWEGPSQ